MFQLRGKFVCVRFDVANLVKDVEEIWKIRLVFITHSLVQQVYFLNGKLLLRLYLLCDLIGLVYYVDVRLVVRQRFHLLYLVCTGTNFQVGF